MSQRPAASAAPYPERQPQIRHLRRLLAVRWCPPIFVYGLPGTGKTSVVRGLLQDLEREANGALVHAYVDCIETHSPRLLVEQLLAQVTRAPWAEPGADCRALGALGVAGLVQGLARHLAPPLRAGRERRCVLALDAAQRLGEPLLAVLLRLAGLIRAPIAVLLVAALPWEKLRPAAAPEPQLLLFPDYAPEEVAAILCRRALRLWSDQDPALLRQFVTVLCGVFKLAAKGVRALAPLLPLYWPLYSRPVRERILLATDHAKLFQQFQPLVARPLLLRALTRQLTAAELHAVLAAGPATNESALQRRALGAEFELPLVGKLLMVAAYIASWTPPTADRRLTSRGALPRHAGSSKRKRAPTAAEVRRAAQPGTFDLRRLTALFHVLARPAQVPARHTSASSLLTQVATLVSLNLLTMVARGHGAVVNAPKLCCNMPRDYIAALAKNVDIELDHYLLDP